ncbi:MAG TPA: UDP-N-acetylglucosamine 1-carboxyvinyltransferase, partial [Bacteroidales bacterium]|nr:UDP-N-acetylglucosamine 1-carboxyvinyltransferase [Bacteroidales bacterium]
EVHGGYSLSGSIKPQGAKNEALQVISAVLLSAEDILIENIPNILDVRNLILLLKLLGVKVKQLSENNFLFNAANIDLKVLYSEEFYEKATKLRGSIMLVGPLLTRFGIGIIPTPGGDKIGRRRLDVHVDGFRNLGATFSYDAENKLYAFKAEKLTGNNMLLEEASVTGTANIIMAAVLAKGKTIIYHAASEPYIQQLCKMLNAMGANISGIGSNLLTINGVDSLGGTTHRILPDMIEVGSFIGMAAITQSDLTVLDVNKEALGIIPRSFEKIGIHVTFQNGNMHIPRYKHYNIEKFIDGSVMTISDGIWPALTPDLLSIFLVTAIQAKGTLLIHQKMFESRLFFVDKLIDMGAQIILCDPHRASVVGINREYNLRATKMTSPDIRAGVALLIAAMSANGVSYINNIEQIDRGYEHIDTRLNAIGAKIIRHNS